MKQKLILIITVAGMVAALIVAGGLMAYELVTYRQSMTMSLPTLATIFVLLMLAFAVAVYLVSEFLQQIHSRTMFRPADTAQGVSDQRERSIRATQPGTDELRQLVGGSNAMLGQIKELEAALKRANDEIEQRVEERTRDLQRNIAERSRAESALQAQFTRSNLVNHITQVISERQDLESILYAVLRQLEDQPGVDLGLVFLYDQETEVLKLVALRCKEARPGIRVDLWEGLVIPLDRSGLRPCKHGEWLNIPDASAVHGGFVELLAMAGLRSTLAMPLLVDNKLFGVLILARLSSESFLEGEREFLHNVGKHLALAGHQAQLHAQLAQAYNELRQSQQTVMQQEKLKALGQMASGIAHDVNNALAPIVGFSELLERLESGMSPTGRKYLNYIKTAGEDIAHIVARLREFYRKRDEAESLARLDLNELAHQVVDMTQPRWRDIPQGQGIMVEMREELCGDLPEVDGIQSEVREALTNLVLNAVDAIPQGGAITVRTRVLHDPPSGTHSKPGHVLLEVIDTGIGMTEEARRRCLEPFYSTKGKRGTGMGLSMVFGVMERHQGRVSIESAPGRGTTVSLIFPVGSRASQTHIPGDQQPPLAAMRILCVDDEPLLREFLKDMLEQDGHTVKLADGGQAGIDAFREAELGRQPFDAVITDLGMPYVDGRKVACVLKRESPATPVIMLTGWGTLMKSDQDLPPHVDSLLSKPPHVQEVREALRKCAAGIHASNPTPPATPEVAVNPLPTAP